MDLGKTIAKILKQKGIKQADLAEKIGKSTTALSQIINGAYRPNQETLEKICDVLEVPVPLLYFLTMTEDDIPEEKRELYKHLAPHLESFIIDLFGQKTEELLKMN